MMGSCVAEVIAFGFKNFTAEAQSRRESAKKKMNFSANPSASAPSR
jgi:hypothetical protein